ncbi:hypothetical protein HQ545_06410 [Candidatus Woesearchaeota archaeon]|nr:hypothetical protein [Candidatus Woesearchaeota archaeon]
MSVHHIIGKDNQKQSCPYCGKKVEKSGWRSLFDQTNHHYKIHNCECGREINIKVDFMGSGHDDWCKDLDAVIEEEEEVESKSQKR